MREREKIQDVMHPGAVTCRHTDTLDKAATCMRDHDCGAIPVVDERDHLVGIVTDRDITLTALARGTALREIEVREAMTKQVAVVHPGDDIQEAERQMSRHQVRRVPVLDDDDHVVGMVALADLALHADKSNVRNDLNRDAVGAVVTAISEPHEHGAAAARP